MRWAKAVSAALAWLMALAAPGLAERRVALVIGEGGYRAAPALANPPNDVRDIAQALRTLGFDVSLRIDVDRAQMTQAIGAFGARSKSADLSLFYYGGHGLQIQQHNFLVPVDAVLRSVADVEASAVPLDAVIDAMAKGGGRRLVFLDACRENPAKGQSVEATPGLARVGKAANFMIAFATQPDAVAFDGTGRNSPFAQALLAHMTTAGVDLTNMMIAVNHDVNVATGGEQAPWENFSLTRQVYLAGEGPADASPEAALWRLAAPERDGSLLDIYLQRYPNGPHAKDARELLKTAVKPAEPTKNRSAEEELWRLALSSREPALVELYRARFPNGAHAGDAEDLAARLAQSQTATSDPGIQCDRLATYPADATAIAPGVDLTKLALNAPAAIEACQKAWKANPASAHYQTLLARAEYAAGDFDEAVSRYRAAAQAGDARALVSLGVLEEKGDHVPKDVAGAYALYEKAAERGSADGAINVAVALADGKVLPKDLARAYALLKKASDEGSATATFDLGYFADKGYGGRESDALALYRRAAAFGDANGHHAAAALLDDGRHTAKDPEAAADELLKAAAADSGVAVNELTGRAQIWSPATVSALQLRLKAMGYYAGLADGRSGPALAPALKRWRLLGDPRGEVAHSGR